MIVFVIRKKYLMVILYILLIFQIFIQFNIIMKLVFLDVHLSSIQVIISLQFLIIDVNSTAIDSLKNISTLQYFLPLVPSPDNHNIFIKHIPQPNPIHYINNEGKVMLLNSYRYSLQIRLSLLYCYIPIQDGYSIPAKIVIGDNCYLNNLSSIQSLSIHDNIASISEIVTYDNPISNNSTLVLSYLQNIRVLYIDTNCLQQFSQFHLNSI